MNEPPQPPPDPFDMTQPMPTVTPQAPPAPAGPAVPAAYVHKFGNVPVYLLTRLAAFCVDIFGVAYLIATFGFHAFESGYLAYGGRSEGGFLSLAASSLAIAFAFAYLCEALFGTTIGKALFALHTRAVNGRHAGPGRVFLRYVLRPIDILAIGPLLALVTPKHRTLGDFAGGTVVSRSRFGPLAVVAGIALILGLGYAQITYGGGLTSVLEVAAESSNFAPDLVAKAAHGLGLGGVPVPVVPLAMPSPTSPATPAATAMPTAAPATESPATFSPAPAGDESPAAAPAGDESPAAASSSDEETAAPADAETPSDEQTSEPEATPTGGTLSQ
jgi:uncharacterized RDD family membrane protein YckC